MARVDYVSIRGELGLEISVASWLTDSRHRVEVSKAAPACYVSVVKAVAFANSFPTRRRYVPELGGIRTPHKTCVPS